jgi:hypothetical protein
MDAMLGVGSRRCDVMISDDDAVRAGVVDIPSAATQVLAVRRQRTRRC